MTEQPMHMSIEGENGFSVGVTATGAGITTLNVPVAGGHRNVVLGYPSLSGYAEDPYYMGSTVGRFANRIANATTIIAGNRIELDANEAPHCLHGGAGGIGRQTWSLARSELGDAIVCTLRSEHGDQGFPGTVDIAVTYRIGGPRVLAIDFYAESDRETVLNLANHAYFNLSDEDTIDRHFLCVHADGYTPVDDNLIPTGAIDPVNGTVFDLREPTALSDVSAQRFDNNFVIRGEAGQLRQAAVLSASGLTMRVESTQPGLQVYTAEHLGEPFHPRQGICLEAQNYPDAPNQPGFPSAALLPGKPYRQTTVLTFEV